MSRVIRGYWFYLLLPILLAAAWFISTAPGAVAKPHVLERVLLFDFLICLPGLYFVFLRSKVGPKAALLRTAVLAGTGLWAASRLLPPGEGDILPWLAWLRYVALPLLIAIELFAFIAVMKHLYSDTPDEAHLIASGFPPLIARALLAEARFWKRVAGWLAGR